MEVLLCRERKMKEKKVFSVSDVELGVCALCPKHKGNGPFARDDNDGLLMSCKAVQGLLISPQISIASYEDCEHYIFELGTNHMDLRTTPWFHVMEGIYH